MIAGADGGDAARRLFPRQAQHVQQRASRFERAGELKQLELQMDLGLRSEL
jgi:hypothetical protein